MKKVLKKFKMIMFILTIILIILSTSVYSADVINPEDYEPASIANLGRISTIGNTIIGAIQFIGSILSVIVLMGLGIKFMYGSAEEKAEYKESFKPYIIGAIMVFSITNFLGILSDITDTGKKVTVMVGATPTLVDPFNIRDLSGSSFSNQDAMDLGNKIVTLLSVIGSVVSVIVLIVLGIKYMTGTVSQKADYKKTLIPYVIGAVLVFASSVIAGVIYNAIP